MLSPPLSVPALFVVGAAAAIVAVLVMDQVMARLPEGETLPFVPAGVLTDTRPDDAPPKLASVVHYTAGLLTGPLCAWFVLAVAGVLSEAALVIAVAGLLLYPLMVGFFVIVVLPRSQVHRNRVPAIRRDWAIAAAAYLLVLVPLVGGAATLL